MVTATLPNEVWDDVIDYCRSRSTGFFFGTSETPLGLSYDVFRTCCLTCRAWVPRSRRNLYTILRFRRAFQVDTCFATITAHPFLADYVRVIWADSQEEYIPFARTDMVLKLRNVQSLMLDGDWKPYPPNHRYHELAARYPITHLTLGAQFQVKELVADLFRLIWAFDSLQNLHLDVDTEGYNITGAESFKISALAERRGRCRALKVLELGVGGGPGSDDRLVPWTNFPPRLAFSTAIVELSLQWSNWRPRSNDSQALLGYIACLGSLQKLTLDVNPRRYRTTAGEDGQAFSTWITSILAQTRAHATLRRVRIRFWRPQTDWFSQPISRYVFLERLVTPAFGELVRELPAHCQLAIELPYGPDLVADSPEWWEKELQARLSLRETTIMVRLHHRTPVKWNVFASRPIWMPMDQDDPSYQEREEWLID
ncbi:hypothetical protein C8Q79DRAFT_1013843 [Trametes meyenii]|nr:hypothetical protein C8Q79DRAFT_1013843 [Trametes meyenii]